MEDATSVTPPRDFAAAETFVRQAREADLAGDEVRCAACCKLVAVALQLEANPVIRRKGGGVSGC